MIKTLTVKKKINQLRKHYW